MESTEYLYHYTSIEKLALILKNQTIRFNSLDKMDDLQEQETADIKNIGQFYYISAWTGDAAESIPMWNMYATISAGVRIKLRRDPFIKYQITAADIQMIEQLGISVTGSSGPYYTWIPITEMIKKSFFVLQHRNESLLIDVEYTQEKSKLLPQLFRYEGQESVIDIGKLGKVKSLYWDFQKERRYLLFILPFPWESPPVRGLAHVGNLLEGLRKGQEKQLFPYYDMKLDPAAFSEMEITLSPKISDGNRLITQSLVEKYNPRASIKESDLWGLL